MQVCISFHRDNKFPQVPQIKIIVNILNLYRFVYKKNKINTNNIQENICLCIVHVSVSHHENVYCSICNIDTKITLNTIRMLYLNTYTKTDIKTYNKNVCHHVRHYPLPHTSYYHDHDDVCLCLFLFFLYPTFFPIFYCMRMSVRFW